MWLLGLLARGLLVGLAEADNSPCMIGSHPCRVSSEYRLSTCCKRPCAAHRRFLAVKKTRKTAQNQHVNNLGRTINMLSSCTPQLFPRTQALNSQMPWMGRRTSRWEWEGRYCSQFVNLQHVVNFGDSSCGSLKSGIIPQISPQNPASFSCQGVRNEHRTGFGE